MGLEPQLLFIRRGEPESPNNMQQDDFDGIFRFSNNSDEEFKVLWNNKEYTFPPHTRSPIIIPNETSENIQEIRKKWAYKWAEKEWFKGAEYERMKNMGNGLPPTRDDATLEPLIQMCLEPLVEARAVVKELPKKTEKFKATKAIENGSDPRAAFVEESKEEVIPKLGPQSTTFNG